jgi:zinc and cadmium transporter
MGDSTFWAVLAAGVFSLVVNAAGIVAISRRAEWARANAVAFVAFAAGTLVTLAFMSIVPEAMALNAAAPALLVVGFFSLMALDRLLTGHPAHDEGELAAGVQGATGGAPPRGVVPVIGIGLHSLVDGVIFAVTFQVSVLTGALAALGMILHEFPEGVLTFVILERGGMARRRATTWALAAAAFTTPVGALLAYPFIDRLDPGALGAMLAISGGALVYVGASHLLPQVAHEGRRRNLLAVAAGVLVAAILALTGE